MTTRETMNAVCRALRGAVFNHGRESELQDGIEAALAAAGLVARREARLTASERPDFMVGDVAVEVKIGGRAADVQRQVERYAAQDGVAGVVVVSTRAKAVRGMPQMLSGIPLSVVLLLRGV